MKNDPPPQASPRWILPLYALIMLLGLLSPFVISAYRKQQIFNNEQAVIVRMREYAAAQEAHFKEAHEYAQEFPKLGSAWADTPVLLPKATDDFAGYRFRILDGQNASAEGGAMSYVDDKGKMTGGYGLLAAPVKYGFTGNYTFLMRGPTIYYVDFGVKTDQFVKSPTEFFIPPHSTILKP